MPLLLSAFSNALLRSELELELIQTQMTQKPVLRAEVYAYAMRASQNRKVFTLERVESTILHSLYALPL